MRMLNSHRLASGVLSEEAMQNAHSRRRRNRLRSGFRSTAFTRGAAERFRAFLTSSTDYSRPRARGRARENGSGRRPSAARCGLRCRASSLDCQATVNSGIEEPCHRSTPSEFPLPACIRRAHSLISAGAAIHPRRRPGLQRGEDFVGNGSTGEIE